MSFFNIASQIAADRSGRPFTRTLDDSNADWGLVDLWHVEAWNKLLNPLYLWLYLAGYKPTTTTFRVSETQTVELDLAGRRITTFNDADSPEVSIRFEPIMLDLTSCAVDLSGLELDFIGEVKSDIDSRRAPAINLDQSNLELSFPVLEAEKEHDTYDPRDPTKLSDSGTPEAQRYWISGKKRISRGFIDHFDRIAAVFESAISYKLKEVWDEHYANQPIGAGDEDADPASLEGKGLFWLLDPHNWDFAVKGQETELVEDVARKIWQKLVQSGYPEENGEWVAGGSVSSQDIWQYSEIAGKLFGVHRHRGRKFADNLRLNIAENFPDFPEALAHSFEDLSYLDLIMVLANFGVIHVPLISGLTITEDFGDEVPFEFLDIQGKTGKTEAFELLYGDLTVATLTYPSKLFREHTEPYSAYAYTIEELVCWEFFPADPNDALGRANNNRLVVVAAPGIQISLPNGNVAEVDLQIIRVQDPKVVPPLFTQIDVAMFYAAWQEHTLPSGLLLFLQNKDQEFVQDERGKEIKIRSEEVDAFQLTPLVDGDGDIDGLRIEYPPSKQYCAWKSGWGLLPGSDRTEMFSMKLEIRVNKFSADQRFACGIWDLRTPIRARRSSFNDRFDPLVSVYFHLVVHTTPGVKLEMQYSAPEARYYFGHGHTDYHSYEQRPVRYFLYEATSSSRDVAPINFVRTDKKYLYHEPRADYYVSDGKIMTDADGWVLTGPADTLDGVTINLDRTRATLDEINTGNSTDLITRHTQFELRQVAVPPDKYHPSTPFWSRLITDLGIGLMPVIGDATDIYDLSCVILTGRDKWGDEVSGGQFLFMACCTALPFVGTGAAKVVFRGAK